VILAGTLLKTGVYGMLRFCLPMFPDAAAAFAPLVSWLAIIAIIYGALTALAQKDMKRLVAYSSVSHMGFIILGIFTFTVQGMSGAILQMINHGISTGGLFLIVGMIYERRHTREMAEFGGLAKTLPIYAGLTMVMVLSSVGLPGLNGFVGEFLILLGSARSHAFLPFGAGDAHFTLWLAALAGLGVILGAVYLLVMYQKVFWGKVTKPENRKLRDLNSREVIQLVALSLVALWIGLYPKPFLSACEKASEPVLTRIAQAVPHGLTPPAMVADDTTPDRMPPDTVEVSSTSRH
jgi:NADH-quinone oxidoreductase subunit M